MLVYAVDLGSTNIKVVLYDEAARPLAEARTQMQYLRSQDRVEFDPERVFDAVTALIGRCAAQALPSATEPALIVVTGQAESLVLVDAHGRSVAPGISWMDERSSREAREIAEHFDRTTSFSVTGEPEPVPTWPATKLRWLARHHPDVLARARRVLMIKDYVLGRLTGTAVGDESTRGFTYLYDVLRRAYWDEMVEFCGIGVAALPEVVPAGTPLGGVLPEVLAALPPAASYTVNAGALDHFCAMLGTDSYRPGLVSASAGTVLSLSMLASNWQFDPAVRLSFHPGLRPGDTVLFTCADSGGVSLSWFQEQVSAGLSYEALERELGARDHRVAPIFLPYLTGVNPPDFNPAARGAFVDLQLRHDRVDLAFAVMEGVAHLLRRNVDDLASHGQRTDAIVSAGGGTASSFWNQLKADVCGLPLRTPDETEAACRGAAILALGAAGVLDPFEPAAHAPRGDDHTFHPRADPARATRYDAFETALERLYGSSRSAPSSEPRRDP